MRVLIVGDVLPDKTASTVAKYLGRQHEVRCFDVFKAATPFQMSANHWLNRLSFTMMRVFGTYEFARTNQKLIEYVRDWRPDWILIVSLRMIHYETIQELRRIRRDAVISGWFMDSIARFDREFMLAADYDALFITDRFVVEKLRPYLGNDRIQFLPLCADPEIHHPVTLTPTEQQAYGSDLALYGTAYYSRLKTIEILQGYDLKIYGAWPEWVVHPLKPCWQGKEIFGEEKAKTLCASKIAINSTHFSAIDAVNKRVFEVAAIGAFQLSQAPGLDGLFGFEEIVRFEGPPDLKEKVDYYLSHPKERDAASARTRARVLREHTYPHRINEMMEKLGLGNYDFPRETDICSPCMAP